MLLNKASRKKSKLKLSEQANAHVLRDYADLDRFGGYSPLISSRPTTAAQTTTRRLAAIFGLQLEMDALPVALGAERVTDNTSQDTNDHVDGDEVLCDPAEVREFLGIIHAHAAKLAGEHENPGVLQLVVITPSDKEEISVSRYRIGDVDGMASVAIAAAESGQNVYVEGRTVRKDLIGNLRGDALNDTRFVYAIITDNDVDKGETAPDIEASVTVESSPGNSHQWLLFACPLTPEPAQDLARRLRCFAGGDGATGRVTGLYRLAGTPNYPKPSKRARGRVPTPTFILARTERLWTLNEMRSAFPEVAASDNTFDGPIDDRELVTIISALASLPNYPPLPRNEFLDITCALRYAADNAQSPELAEKVHELWDSWARQGVGKYHEGRTWASLKGNKPNPITIKTLYWFAAHAGWSRAADFNESVAKLAALQLFEYERVRESEAKKLHMRVPILDKYVEEARIAARGDDAPDGKQGTRFKLYEPEPWDEPVDGAVLLEDICREINTYVILDIAASVIAIALWVVAEYAIMAFQIFPRLLLKSPTRQCGKSTLIDVIAPLVLRAIVAGNASAAALFRIIDRDLPTFLLDEADTFIGGKNPNEDIRGIINTGHKKGGQVVRCVGEDQEPRAFATYCPTVMAAIGRLPSTIEDRSIIIKLKRKKKDEVTKRFLSKYEEGLHVLASKCARFAADNFKA